MIVYLATKEIEAGKIGKLSDCVDVLWPDAKNVEVAFVIGERYSTNEKLMFAHGYSQALEDFAGFLEVSVE